jgi:hypothetical protein
MTYKDRSQRDLGTRQQLTVGQIRVSFAIEDLSGHTSAATAAGVSVEETAMTQTNRKVASLLAVTAPAMADPWKDESGHGRKGGKEWKQEYRDGNCKVERKWKRGQYKEEVKCDGAPWAWGYRVPPPIAYREPVMLSTTWPSLPPGPAYGEPYRDDLGRYCREYQTTGTINGRQEHLYGTACLQPDGSWSFND